jgi:hypothetical protein
VQRSWQGPPRFRLANLSITSFRGSIGAELAGSRPREKRLVRIREIKVILFRFARLVAVALAACSGSVASSQVVDQAGQGPLVGVEGNARYFASRSATRDGRNTYEKRHLMFQPPSLIPSYFDGNLKITTL